MNKKTSPSYPSPLEREGKVSCPKIGLHKKV